jgi:hypothetical protein
MSRLSIGKDAPPKPPPSSEVLATLTEVEGLDSDTKLEVYDIFTSDTHKF